VAGGGPTGDTFTVRFFLIEAPGKGGAGSLNVSERPEFCYFSGCALGDFEAQQAWRCFDSHGE